MQYKDHKLTGVSPYLAKLMNHIAVATDKGWFTSNWNGQPSAVFACVLAPDRINPSKDEL